MKITKQAVRNFLLNKQLLLPSQNLKGNRGIEKVFYTLRSIQYDPQNPCGRNTDLVLQARVAGIHPSDYHIWLYEQRKGVEFYDKELCVLPVEDLPLCRKHYKSSRKRKIDLFLSEYQKELDLLVKEIEKHGPICSSDTRDSRKVDMFWEPAQWGKVALDTLWKIGKLTIASRKNGRKYYDLPSKVYGSIFKWNQRKYADGLHQDQILRRIQSVGMLPLSGTGQGWLGIGLGREIAPLLKQLIEGGKLIEVEISDVKSGYVINSSDKNILELSKQNRHSAKKAVFLAPLDNLLWDRKMVKEIFNFEYKWEVYTPKKDRTFGHYVLPILYGDIFVGRIEPFLQKDKTLEIKGFWLEENLKLDSKLKNALDGCLENFKKYLKADRVKWSCSSAW